MALIHTSKVVGPSIACVADGTPASTFTLTASTDKVFNRFISTLKQPVFA